MKTLLLGLALGLTLSALWRRPDGRMARAIREHYTEAMFV